MSTILEAPQTEEQTGHKPYWSEETNRRRSETLSGRTMSFQIRAQMYASHKTGQREYHNSPIWIAAYEERLADLRMQEHIRQMVAQGALGGEPLKASGTSQLGKMMQRVTVCYIDTKKLEQELATRRMSFDTLSALAQWAGLNEVQINEIVEGRAASVTGK